MCEKCKDVDTDNVQETEQLAYQSLCLAMPIENLENVKYDAEEFQKGVNDFSFIAGKLSALINVGLSPAEAMEIVINTDTINHNYRLTKENNVTSIEIAKIGDVKVGNNTI